MFSYDVAESVHRVMTGAEADVAVFVDRGFPEVPRRVLVPFMGGRHDRLALRLASRLARNLGADVTVLHVPPHGRPGDSGGGPAGLREREAIERLFSDPGEPTQLEVGDVLHLRAATVGG